MFPREICISQETILIKGLFYHLFLCILVYLCVWLCVGYMSSHVCEHVLGRMSVHGGEVNVCGECL